MGKAGKNKAKIKRARLNETNNPKETIRQRKQHTIGHISHGFCKNNDKNNAYHSEISSLYITDKYIKNDSVIVVPKLRRE
jgi:hypothetical protein